MTNVHEFSSKELGEDATVRITGKVQRITNKEDFAIINLVREEEIPVIIFENINVSKGQTIEITGKTQEYKGEQEVIAEKIVIK